MSKTISTFSVRSGSAQANTDQILVNVDDPNFVVMLRSDFDELIKNKDDTIR